MARQFHEIFAGLADAYGTYDLSSPHVDERGKKTGRPKTVKDHLTIDLYNQHLRGEGAGLGVIPLMRDDRIVWFAIDVDDYNDKGPDHWSEVVEKLQLPLIVCRSKSNGTHMFGFLSEPVPAADVHKIIKKYLRLLKLPQKTEIFPKQTKHSAGKSVGNWINLPYFGDTRPCVYKGRDLPLKEFMQLVEARTITLADLAGTVKERKQAVEKSVVPPCIEAFESDGIPEGGRNNALFHVAVYLQRRWPEDWSERLFEWNSKFCDPPSPNADLMNIVRSIGKKTYQYKCNDQPMTTVCDKVACMRREFGIGNPGDEAYVDYPISNITRVLTEPVTWVIEVNGTRIRLDTTELFSYNRFRMRVAEELSILLPARTNNDWDRMIAELMQNVVDEQVPRPATNKGHIMSIFKSWVALNAPASYELERVSGGAPYYDREENTILFQPLSFMTYLQTQMGNRLDHDSVWAVMAEHNVREVHKVIYSHPTELWSYPCPDGPWFDLPDELQERF